MSNDVRRPKEYEQMLTDLCQSENRIFLSYKDALVFAACVGYSVGNPREMDKSSERVKLHIFKGKFDDAIFNCLGLIESNDPSILGYEKEEDKIKIFEKYAAAGLGEIKKNIYDSPSEWDVALIEYITSQYKTNSSILSNFKHLAE